MILNPFKIRVYLFHLFQTVRLDLNRERAVVVHRVVVPRATRKLIYKVP